MKICEEAIHYPESISRYDHKPGLTSSGNDAAILARRTLQSTDYCSTNGPHPPTVFADALDQRCHPRTDLISLGMHGVFGWILGVYRLECARPDFQVQARDHDSCRGKPIE